MTAVLRLHVFCVIYCLPYTQDTHVENGQGASDRCVYVLEQDVGDEVENGEK